ncbi:MAG: G-D-S-L family lipolytic protein [Saprospiraceae bacterium]|nr:G-D-S-L family lipolytic protein [Saprospiraceae bacterium]
MRASQTIALIFVLLNCFQVNSGHAYPYHDKVNTSADSLLIVAFGNSITAERATIEAVFAQRLPTLLQKVGVSCTVRNAGIGGSHTGRQIDHDLFKIPHALDRLQNDVLKHKPDITIVGFGTNDAHIDANHAHGKSRIPLDNYRANLKYIVTELQRIGSGVILIAPNCLGKNYPSFQNDRLFQYVAVVRNIAQEFRTGLVDNFALFKDYGQVYRQDVDDLMLDGVHPNDKGHELMANNLTEVILEISNQKR